MFLELLLAIELVNTTNSNKYKYQFKISQELTYDFDKYFKTLKEHCPTSLKIISSDYQNISNMQLSQAQNKNDNPNYYVYLFDDEIDIRLLSPDKNAYICSTLFENDVTVFKHITGIKGPLENSTKSNSKMYIFLLKKMIYDNFVQPYSENSDAFFNFLEQFQKFLSNKGEDYFKNLPPKYPLLEDPEKSQFIQTIEKISNGLKAVKIIFESPKCSLKKEIQDLVEKIYKNLLIEDNRSDDKISISCNDTETYEKQEIRSRKQLLVYCNLQNIINLKNLFKKEILHLQSGKKWEVIDFFRDVYTIYRWVGIITEVDDIKQKESKLNILSGYTAESTHNYYQEFENRSNNLEKTNSTYPKSS